MFLGALCFNRHRKCCLIIKEAVKGVSRTNVNHPNYCTIEETLNKYIFDNNNSYLGFTSKIFSKLCVGKMATEHNLKRIMGYR